MRSLDRRRVLTWAMSATAGCVAGSWMAFGLRVVPQLYFAKVPERDADLILSESLFDSQTRFIESIDGLQRVSERDGSTEAVSLRFYCPKGANEWGEIVQKWSWKANWSPALVILEPNMLVVPAFDPATTAEIYISSKSTSDRWIRLVRLEKGLESIELNRPIDVTRWVRNGDYVRVKYRLKAVKLMTHPTPDDPIGFAGAQCLRQTKTKAFATRLLLWR